jgi:flagellar basal-body rod modification protein FlgD
VSQSLSGTGTSPLSTATAAAAGLTGTSSTGSSTSSSGSSSANALGSLTDNFQTFLTMLLTQLQNQDPTSPMDSSQFTTELVQFAGVEQQISTNSNLTQLIQLTQDSSVVQSGQLLGKQVDVTSSQLSLQSGTSTIDFTAPSAGPAAIAIYDGSGNQVYTATVNAAQGSNSFTWNGQTGSGATAPDGAYKVAVAGTAADGSGTILPFTVIGTVTGVQSTGTTVQLELGQLTVDMSAVTSVQN